MKKEELKTIISNKKLPTHIAIILDGNGRWAKKGLCQEPSVIKKVLKLYKK